MLVFAGETGQLITAVLRPGNTHGAAGVQALSKRLPLDTMRPRFLKVGGCLCQVRDRVRPAHLQSPWATPSGPDGHSPAPP